MKRIGDHYVLESLLASGGMASLYRGLDERTSTRVAVKVLKQSLLDDPIIAQRFRREALTLSRQIHPGIVRVFELGQSGEEVFMVLELLEGETLEALLVREGPLAPARALPIVASILDALATCHELDIVHRDVKPSNVMLVPGEGPKLIDFGLAKVAGDVSQKLTETGTVHGTPFYMAPEQCRGEDVGPASDIYSVGVLSYEMLAGKTPFAGSDAATIMAAHLFVDPPALANVSPGLGAVVHSALAKRAEDRPCARALRDAFVAAMAGADPVTRGIASAATRVEQLAKPREARAIGSTDVTKNDVRASAIVWMKRGDRAARLLGCLGTAGIAASIVETDDVPDGGGIVVLSGVDRLRRMREHDRKRPVVVVDVGGPNETTEVIRLGADDMLLREAPDADLVAKVKRLARRKVRA